MRIVYFLILLAGTTSVCCAQADPEMAGPYSVASLDTAFTDTFFNTGAVNLVAHYPQGVAAGVVAQGSFPVVAFGHGFQIPIGNYKALCEHIASWGYIVLAIDEQNNPFAIDHQTFGRQMGAGIQWMQSLGTGQTTRFAGRVATGSAAFGHSMGGGASLLLAAEWQGLTAVAGLAPAETSPSAVAQMPFIASPLFVLASLGDSVTPVASVQQQMFDAKTAGLKTMHILLQGGHCNFTDSPNFLCEFAAGTEGDAGTLTTTTQQGRARRYLVAFFNVYLKNQAEYRGWLCGPEASADNLIATQTNEACTVAQPEALFASGIFNVFPNPSPSPDVFVKGGSGSYQAFDAAGRGVLVSPLGENFFRLDARGPGLYFIRDVKAGHSLKFILE